MKPYTRQASVLWLGTRQDGQGALSTPSAVLKTARYASGGDTRRTGTSPPELIAAAHAASFSLSLAHELGQAGYHPRRIDATTTVTMEDVAAAWTLTQIHLDVVATVPRVAQCDFVDAALRAKAGCPISRLLNANISMRATLSQREVPAKAVSSQTLRAAPPGPVRKPGPRRKPARN